MKRFSRVALAAALITSIGSVAIVAPADAKKKEEQKGDGLKLSADVRTAAIAAQAAVTAKDFVTAETNVAKIESIAKTDDEKYIGQAVRLQLESAKISASGAEDAKAEVALAPILDALLANPSTPKADLGRFAYFRGNIAFNSQQYPVAMQLYQRARDAGYANDDLGLQIVKSKVESGDVNGGIAELDSVVKAQNAAGKPVPEAWYRYAIAKLYHANNSAATIDWTRRWLSAYGTPKNWRDAIYTFGFQGAGATRLDKRQRIDLFRLMRATKSLADQGDYLEYAQSCVDLGLPNEAKTVIDEGRAVGKIPASSVTSNQLYNDAQTGIKADKSFTAQEAAANASADGSLSAQTADAYLGAGNYAKAITFYNNALQKGGAKINADDINTHLGIAMALSGDKAGAKTKFAAVKMAPRTEIANLWTAYIDAAPPAAAAPTAPAAAPAG